jgi:hypothetical protein
MTIDEVNRIITETIKALVDAHKTDLIDPLLRLGEEFRRITDDPTKNLTDTWFNKKLT